VFLFAAPGPPAGRAQGPTTTPPPGQLLVQGRALFEDSCASCHGTDLRGIPKRAPSLRGVGELAADFYLRTGRMPLLDPEDQPRRARSPFTAAQIRALVAYVGSFGGPRIPAVHPERGSEAEGFRLFSENCMGCHQVLGQGGIVPGAWIPDLKASKPVDVAEAVAIGPYVMPRFTDQLTPRQVDSLARYVEYTHHPKDAGGWSLGHIGPIPEGAVAWFLGAFALVLVTRIIGEGLTR
jgi:ubiquinol-cytochrome c reductase cytochrome c subunit